MATRTWDAWTYRESAEVSARGKELTGFSVEAIDGHIGKIDAATMDVGSSYVVVDTGPWIFGRKVMLPAGTIDRVDWNDEKVYVDRTKDQIKDSPELTDADLDNPDYRDRLGTYYGDTYDRTLP
ncbi:MAG TPA: PRC-barrel domain containing protein [Intrasporangium sp.]|nr:PRC-barrel domain containing protein [Intrasporangium sp.]